jgi:hypothetical protein
MAKKPAAGPPTSSANTAEESIRGAQYQVTRASGVTMAAVGQHRVVGDRHRLRAGDPLGAELGELGEGEGHAGGVVDAEAGQCLVRADLHPDVGPAQGGEGVLVGRAVAEEEDGRRPDPVAQRLQRPALVGVDHQQLDGLVAVMGVDAVQRRRPGLDVLQRPALVLLGRPPVVEGDGRRLHLQLGAGGAGGDLGQVALDARPQVQLALGQALAEAEVELPAVAADQVDLGGQAGQPGEIPQRPARDDRHVGVGQGGQRPQRDHRVRPRRGGHRVVHDGRHGAVVVARDQQLGRARQVLDLGFELIVDGLGHSGEDVTGVGR